MSENDFTKEQRILRMCKKVLTDVAKDTYTQPGLKHPLSEHTIHGIRDCLQLITSRELEIAEALGQTSSSKPYFIDEPQNNVVVNITPKKNKNTDNDT